RTLLARNNQYSFETLERSPNHLLNFFGKRYSTFMHLGDENIGAKVERFSSFWIKWLSQGNINMYGSSRKIAGLIDYVIADAVGMPHLVFVRILIWKIIALFYIGTNNLGLVDGLSVPLVNSFRRPIGGFDSKWLLLKICLAYS